ncbi:MAG TPA: antitoxin family protein [Pyrinomonadaceae bacterium]|jgi:predicted DNA-binding antitoxin AbrB/MazE fold protein
MQTIDAIYENGVLRPIQHFKMEEGRRVKLTVEEYDGNENDSAASFLDIAQDTGLPRDYAANIDHYLYGLPKQTETYLKKLSKRVFKIGREKRCEF